jgi:endo-1,4-beta-xylanase
MTEAKDDLFEASNTYKVVNTNTYITLVEAISPKGRYFRIWKCNGLDGKWEPFSTTPIQLGVITAKGENPISALCR